MGKLQIAAGVDSTTQVAMEIASELELDRGVAVVGTVWTKANIIEYTQIPGNHLFCWSDSLAESQYVPTDPESDVMPNIRCKYRASVGLRYRTELYDSGKKFYREKFIDHFVVDHTKDTDTTYETVASVMNDLCNAWSGQPKKGKVKCWMDVRDLRWIDLLQTIGFNVITRKEINGVDSILLGR